jgi:Zn-dependent peptidase ImmA (M78 family)
VFRPLEGLLGFCIRQEGVAGVVVSTQRPLRIQRFTGAHELGHVVLGHAASLDGEEILGRGGGLRNEIEIAADSFASSFLLPKWLLQMHARRQGWNRASMSDPRAVYQLALRSGASYEATCVALERHGIIEASTRQALVNTERRRIKSELLEGFEPENYHVDVWVLTEKDQGATLEGQPDDLFILRLSEHAGAGYIWDAAGLAASGFAVLRDKRDIPPPEKGIGGPVTRLITARTLAASSGTLDLQQRRPWEDGEPLATLAVSYELFGKEVGMPRAPIACSVASHPSTPTSRVAQPNRAILEFCA